jgi:catechol 2,3-dioxygenase-like lactoylglutathione lyase family enzyme
MALADLIGEYGLVVKVDVSNIQRSVQWYEQKLQLVPDPRFDQPGWWAQLYLPDFGPRIAIGLNYNAQAGGSGGERTTFVVDDIVQARNNLIAQGVQVSTITTVPPGVKLANFEDPDRNQLGLRQNPPSQPTVKALRQEGGH